MKLGVDNKVFTSLGKIIDCVWLTVLWFVCCIPVVTIGASNSAFYYSVHKSIRGNRGYTTRNFFHGFKNNFKQATLSYLVWLVVMAVLVSDAWITLLVLRSGSTLGLFFYFFDVLIALAFGWGCYIFAYSARFENSIKITLKNCFLMALRHLPWTLLIIIIFLAEVVAIYLVPIFIVIFPAVIMLFYDFILERIFRQYMSEEDLQKERENEMIDRM